MANVLTSAKPIYCQIFYGAIVHPEARDSGHSDALEATSCTGEELWLVDTVAQLAGVPYELKDRVVHCSDDLFITIRFELLYLRLNEGSVPNSIASPSG